LGVKCWLEARTAVLRSYRVRSHLYGIGVPQLSGPLTPIRILPVARKFGGAYARSDAVCISKAEQPWLVAFPKLNEPVKSFARTKNRWTCRRSESC
jgi:hypothetical protein